MTTEANTARPPTGPPEPESLRLPPHDTAAEEALLGALLIDDTITARVRPIVQPADCYREKNAWVLEAVYTLADAGRSATSIAVANELAKRGRLTTIGGNAYLASLMAEVGTTVGVEYYAELIRDAARHRALIGLAGRLAQRAYDQAASPADTIATVMAELRGVIAGEAVGMRSIGDLLTARLDWLMTWADAPRTASRAISTGLPSLDRCLAGGGLTPGLYVVAGATSMGKSTVLRTICRNVALAGHGAAILSLEQDADEVTEELVMSTAGINQQAHDVSGRGLDAAEWARFHTALDRLGRLPLWVDDSARLRPADVLARLEALRADHPGLRVAAVDYVQLMDSGSTRRDERDDERIATVARSLRDGAKQLGLAVLLGSQLVKEADDPKANPSLRPTLRHLRGGGALTYVAKAVWGLYRPDYPVERGIVTLTELAKKQPDRVVWSALRGAYEYRPLHTLEIIMLKQQRGQAAVRARLHFDPTTRRVTEQADAGAGGSDGDGAEVDG